MEAVAYSNFRQNLRSYMKQVNEDAETLIVTSKEVLLQSFKSTIK